MSFEINVRNNIELVLLHVGSCAADSRTAPVLSMVTTGLHWVAEAREEVRVEAKVGGSGSTP